MKAKTIIFVLSVLLVVTGVSGLFLFVLYPPGSEIQTEFGTVDVGMNTKAKAVDAVRQRLEMQFVELVSGNGQSVIVRFVEPAVRFDEQRFQSSLCIKTKQTCSVMDCLQIDEQEIQQILESISKPVIAPISASIVYSDDSGRYIIKPETEGTRLVAGAAGIVISAMQSGETDINMRELGCYVEPDIRSDDEQLCKKLEFLNQYADVSFTFRINEEPQETLWFADFKDWLKIPVTESGEVDVNGEYILNEDLLDDYVTTTNAQYTTRGRERSFTTSTGDVVSVSGGTYGWDLDMPKFRDILYNGLTNRESFDGEMPFIRTGATVGDKDFGNSYVEVSIADQKAWLYVDGELISSCNVVTGNVSAGHNTRRGVFYLVGKYRDRTLRGWNDDGTKYASFVSYWMPFDGGIGLHDATWRYSFGGNIYKYNGSHGCVNMPKTAAAEFYEVIDAGWPIIVW